MIRLLVQHHCYSVSEREQAHSRGWIQQQPQIQQGRGWDYMTGTKSIHRICKSDLYIRTTGNTCSTAQVMFGYPGLSAMDLWLEGVWVEAPAEAGQGNYRATSAPRVLATASFSIKVWPLPSQTSGFRVVLLVLQNRGVLCDFGGHRELGQSMS